MTVTLNIDLSIWIFLLIILLFLITLGNSQIGLIKSSNSWGNKGSGSLGQGYMIGTW